MTLPLVSYGGTSVLVTIVMIMIAEGVCMVRTDERYEAMEKRRRMTAKKAAERGQKAPIRTAAAERSGDGRKD